MDRGEFYRNKYGRGGRGRGRSPRGRGRSPRGHVPRDGEGHERAHIEPRNDRIQPPLTAASWQQLGDMLRELHNRNYGAYHELERYFFEFHSTSNGLSFTLEFDHVQGDPYASPSRAHMTVSTVSAAFPVEMHRDKTRNVALCDYLTRVFAVNARDCGADAKTVSSSWQGAKGGDIAIDAPGQHVIERTSVNVLPNGDVEARFNINLPARGRSICGDWAYTILVETLPQLVEQSLVFQRQDKSHLWKHVQSVEDQETLRGMLKDAGLVGFVVDGAVLPRQSGASDLPLSGDKAVLFKSPESLRRSFTLPNCGLVTGMGIPRGVTLFVGGGFHGKSTVLKALEVGVYNHVPADGREFVVMDPHAAKIRSEDSRSVVCTDISAFIDNLPFKQDTTRFSTADASGSTSQAANIVEALEVGATTLLIDEDTCATNFMIRDWKMQQLVAKNKEPITPFISKVRALFAQRGVSSVLVIGGAGDYFSVADHVIMMDSYEPRDVTADAKKIASEHCEIQQDTEFGRVTYRIPLKCGFEVNGKEVLDMLESEINRTDSLDAVGFHKKSGFYTRPRKLELAAAINRLRTAKLTQ
uniref:Isopentenyl-diphosphate delta-isomerase n=1 Tax=Hyaloperonospora arabidopsidis (strain Emoy2) TaxID=559515 RepID=M4BD41_HYAAE